MIFLTFFLFYSLIRFSKLKELVFIFIFLCFVIITIFQYIILKHSITGRNTLLKKPTITKLATFTRLYHVFAKYTIMKLIITV